MSIIPIGRIQRTDILIFINDIIGHILIKDLVEIITDYVPDKRIRLLLFNKRVLEHYDYCPITDDFFRVSDIKGALMVDSNQQLCYSPKLSSSIRRSIKKDCIKTSKPNNWYGEYEDKICRVNVSYDAKNKNRRMIINLSDKKTDNLIYSRVENNLDGVIGTTFCINNNSLYLTQTIDRYVSVYRINLSTWICYDLNYHSPAETFEQLIAIDNFVIFTSGWNVNKFYTDDLWSSRDVSNRLPSKVYRAFGPYLHWPTMPSEKVKYSNLFSIE